MTDRSSRLDGCVAIVTGAAGGQGAAEARLLVERGAQVLIGRRRRHRRAVARGRAG